MDKVLSFLVIFWILPVDIKPYIDTCRQYIRTLLGLSGSDRQVPGFELFSKQI